jgi:hypothetical protein
MIRAVLIAALLFFGFGFALGYVKGVSGEKLEQAEKVQELQAQAVARAIRHTKRVERLRSRWEADNNAQLQKDAATIADLRAGVKRLRIRVRQCEADPGTPAEGTDGAGSAELSGEAAAELWNIVGDADEVSRKLEALQKWARTVVDECK